MEYRTTKNLMACEYAENADHKQYGKAAAGFCDEVITLPARRAHSLNGCSAGLRWDANEISSPGLSVVFFRISLGSRDDFYLLDPEPRWQGLFICQ
jgi:hypothetical protein